jgi:hypothetical protein
MEKRQKRHVALCLLLLLGLAMLKSSCINTRVIDAVRIPKGQTIYQEAKGAGGAASVNEVVLPNNTLAQLSLVEARVAIHALPSATGEDSAALSFFFPYQDKPAASANTRYYAGQKLRFFESYPIFQAITVPVKLRPALHDTLEYRAAGGFDVGISWGWKHSFHTYRNVYHQPTGQFLSKRISQFSIVPGAFLTLGTEELNMEKKNTKRAIGYIREVPILSPGGFLVLGVNRVNVGLALGADFSFGSAARVWVYQGKPWLGVVLSLDLLQGHDPFDL